MDLVAIIGIVLGVAGLALGVIQIRHTRRSPQPEPTALPWVHESKGRLLELAATDPAFDRKWRSHVDDALEQLGDLRTIITHDRRFGAARRVAARRLAQGDRPSDIWFLVDLALTDDDFSFVREIGEALPGVRSVDVCPVLIDELGSTGDAERQERLVRILSAFETVAARDALIAFVTGNRKDAMPGAVIEAMKGVTTWNDELVRDFLLSCLDSSLPVHSLRRTAAEGLAGYLDSPRVLKALAASMSSEDEYLRLAAITTLRESYAPGVVEVLKAGLDDGYWRIRREAFEELQDRDVRLDTVPSRSELRKPPGGKPSDVPPADYPGPDVIRA